MITSKSARWLDLIAFLVQHRVPVTREQIFQHVAGYGPTPETSDRHGGAVRTSRSPRRGRGRKGRSARGSARQRVRPSALESARRKFERDKADLRSLGIRIERRGITGGPRAEPNVGYVLHSRDPYLPYLELLEPGTSDPDQLYPGLIRMVLSRADVEVLDRATARVAERMESPLARAARSARRRLGFALPFTEEALEQVLARRPPQELERTLETLQRAVVARQAVRCRSRSLGHDVEEERTIEPYGVFFNWSRWYCVARAPERDALQVFRVDRMRDARAGDGPDGEFVVPDDFAIRDFVSRAPWDLSDDPPTRVVVRFQFPESRWVLAERLGKVLSPFLDDGGAVIEFQVREMDAFLRWLLPFRRQADVMQPAAVTKSLAALRERVRTMYQ
jgi:predicted DNA-binding transcriptional regulator YafY